MGYNTFVFMDKLSPYSANCRGLAAPAPCMQGRENVCVRAFYSVGYPSKAFHAVNGYALRRMARHLNHRGQRRYRLKFADTYYGELNHYGMHWLRWADVRRRRY